MEKRVALAYKNLAKARTKAQQKRYEDMIVRYEKKLTAELLRIRKSKNPAVTAPVVETPITPVAFVPDAATWENTIPADFLYYADSFE